jgi:hypothetical protein
MTVRDKPRQWILDELHKLGKSKLLLHTERSTAIAERAPLGPSITLADLHHAYTKNELRNHVREMKIVKRDLHSISKELLIEIIYDHYNTPEGSSSEEKHKQMLEHYESDEQMEEEEDNYTSMPMGEGNIIINHPVNCKFVFGKRN